MPSKELNDFCNRISAVKNLVELNELGIIEAIQKLASPIEFSEHHYKNEHLVLNMAKIFKHFCQLSMSEINLKFLRNVNKNNELLYRYDVLVNLLEREVLIFDEILCLTENSYIDGAMQRWRTLYEYCIIMMFIEQNDKAVAKSFSNSVRSSMIAGLAPKTNYAWAKAAPCFENEKQITFTKIKKIVETESKFFDNTYKMTCQLIHASPVGAYLNFGYAQPDLSNTDIVQYNLKMICSHSFSVLYSAIEAYLNLYNDGSKKIGKRALVDLMDLWRVLFDALKEAPISDVNERPTSSNPITMTFDIVDNQFKFKGTVLN